MGKLMKIRRADVCAECGVALADGTEAYWDAAAKVVRCVPCGATNQPTPVATSEVSLPTLPTLAPIPPTPIARDIAGGSAKKEYERRSARELAKKEQIVAEDAEWRRTQKEKHPLVGRVAAALTPAPKIGPESQPTKAWKIGAEGEERVAQVLAPVAGIEVLHDRRVPRTTANIDHIVVGPSGVFVIDAKKYAGGIEVRDVGSLFRLDERLYVSGRDQSKLVEGVRGQIEVVRTALGDEFGDVPIRGVLCFIGCEWGWIKKKKVVKGVTALWPLALPDHVSAVGDLGPRIPAIANHLRSKLKPAT